MNEPKFTILVERPFCSSFPYRTTFLCSDIRNADAMYHMAQSQYHNVVMNVKIGNLEKTLQTHIKD